MEKVYYITVDGNKIQYTLVRSARKTIGITVTKDGRVKVSAPFNIAEKQVKSVIEQKGAWIGRKLEEMKRAYHDITNQRQFVDGEHLLYLGNEYSLKIRKDSKVANPGALIEGGNIIVVTPEGKLDNEEVANTKQILKAWYINQFAEIVRERIGKYASLLGVSPAKITIREQKTRWGSCSGKGSINLNWRLIMAPIGILDYVLIHELCHMKEMNHSKSFWNHVKSILPDYSERRKWLKTNGHRLLW